MKWTINAKGDWLTIKNEKNNTICEMCRTRKDQKINAKLISVSPELLEACKAYMKEWENPESNGNPHLFVSNLYDKGVTHKIRQVVNILEEK